MKSKNVMKKILLAVVVFLFAYWLITNAMELHSLMKKYPKEFKQQGDFSFYKFYNTYRTLSYGDIMVKRGYVHHEYCVYMDFKNKSEEVKLLPLIKAEQRKLFEPDSDYYNNVEKLQRFGVLGSNCYKQAKLINFEFKCKEAYATYACESGDYVNEFTYTVNSGEKCSLISYKKSWGIEPKRSVQYTKDFIWGGVSYSKFDSPMCAQTNH